MGGKRRARREERDIRSIMSVKNGADGLYPPDRRVLLYYFSFPHYRAAVLTELKCILGDRLELVSGNLSRAGLNPVSAEDMPDLSLHSTKRIGPFTWESGVVWKAISNKYSDVLLGPAVSSISTWLILFVRRLLGRRTFLWGQCGKPGDVSLKRLMQELMNRMATALFVYGGLEELGAKELGTSNNKIHKVRNAVPLVPVQYTQAELHTKLMDALAAVKESRMLRLVYVGRVNAEKHIDILLKAGEIIKEEYEELTIQIIGDGPEIPSLRARFPDSRYEFVGAIYDKELLQAEISKATFVVSPCTMGLLALDALSVGTPVLVPNNPRNGSEVEALTPNVNGFWFEFQEPSSLANSVEDALNRLDGISSNLYFDSRAKGIREWSAATVANNIVSAMATYHGRNLP